MSINLLQLAMDFLSGMITRQKLTELGANEKDLQASWTGQLDLGSGYSVDAEREKRAARLAQLCNEAVSNPAWLPNNGITYCNRSVNFIAQGMGYFGFLHNSLANEILTHMHGNPEWRIEDDLGRISGLAMRGVLIVLGTQGMPHGHVCVAAPYPAQLSGSWGRDVPIVANVGQHNGIMRLSEAFKKDQPPIAFILERENC